MGHSVVIAVAFGAVFTAAILGAGEALFSALGGRGEVLANALRYSNLVFGAAVPIWIVNLLAAALRGAGNVRIPAILTAVGAAMTLCLSLLLIFSWGPFPRFGVAGAGLAMIVYYVIATAALITYLRSPHTPIRLVRTRIRWRLMKDILGVGTLSAVGTVVANLTVVLATGFVGGFGGAAIAGYGMASRPTNQGVVGSNPAGRATFQWLSTSKPDAWSVCATFARPFIHRLGSRIAPFRVASPFATRRIVIVPTRSSTRFARRGLPGARHRHW